MSDSVTPARTNPPPTRPAAPRRDLTDPARYVLQMFELLQAWGIARSRVLRAAGRDEGWFSRLRGDERLTMAEVEPLFDAARALAGRSDLGFEFGLRLKPTAHGLLGYGLIGSPDLEAAWRLAARQQHHLTEAFALHYDRHGAGGRARFTPLVEMPEDRLHFNLELLAVSVRVGVELLLGGRAPSMEVRLSMPPPPHRARYLDLLPTRFRFDPGAPPGVEVSMSRALLQTPLPMAAPGIVAGVESHLSNVRPATAAAVAWAETVMRMLRSVDGAMVSAKTVAARLGVSARTVDRRLGDEGTSFSALRDEVRFERARDWLARGEFSVAQIAARLGYRDAANFSRAFRRQAGLPPTEYQRLKASPKDGPASPTLPGGGAGGPAGPDRSKRTTPPSGPARARIARGR